jgi:hypothetical protein
VARAVDGGDSGSRAPAPELPDPAKAPATRNLERVTAFPRLLERQRGDGQATEAPPETESEPSQPSGGGYGGGGGSGSGPTEPTPVPEGEAPSEWNPWDPGVDGEAP